MRKNREFGSTPFAVGSMVGIRSFGVDGDGTLTGAVPLTRHVTLLPGTNEARCMSLEQSQKIYDLGRQPGEHCVETCTTRSCWLCERTIEHRLAGQDCSCGFWVYNDPGHLGRNAPEGRVGIFEGFGHVTYGPYGFRCSKGRLLALVREDPGRTSLSTHVGRRLRRIGQVGESFVRTVRAMGPVPVLVAAVLGAVLAYLSPLDVSVPVGAVTGAVIGAVLPTSLLIVAALVLGQVLHEPRPGPIRTDVPIEVTARLYGVPVFDTVEQALAEFPLTRPEP